MKYIFLLILFVQTVNLFARELIRIPDRALIKHAHYVFNTSEGKVPFARYNITAGKFIDELEQRGFTERALCNTYMKIQLVLTKEQFIDFLCDEFQEDTVLLPKGTRLGSQCFIYNSEKITTKYTTLGELIDVFLSVSDAEIESFYNELREVRLELLLEAESIEQVYDNLIQKLMQLKFMKKKREVLILSARAVLVKEYLKKQHSVLFIAKDVSAQITDPQSSITEAELLELLAGPLQKEQFQVV